jgi:hypothetical protein
MLSHSAAAVEVGAGCARAEELELGGLGGLGATQRVVGRRE